ncbi:MAG: hypothetical protein PSN34_13385, partial [Urechidicola sp.]|nr:hypothetical protein [Urechidicola sp.]
MKLLKGLFAIVLISMIAVSCTGEKKEADATKEKVEVVDGADAKVSKKCADAKCSKDCTDKDCEKCAAKKAECKAKCASKDGKKCADAKCSKDCTDKDCEKCATKKQNA